MIGQFRNRLRHTLDKLLHGRGDRRRFGASRATEQDVVNCYRLLLNKEPDEEGMRYWRHLIDVKQIPIDVVVDAIVSSPAFKAGRDARFEPALVKCPDFEIFVRRNDLFIGSSIQRSQQYEPHVTKVLRSLLKPGDAFVDVGANIGYFTLLAASLVGPSGSVIAFEPNPNNCDLLRRSLAQNNSTNVRLHQNAVAESPQRILLTDGGADSNGRILRADEMAGREGYLASVDAVTLDDALQHTPRIDVIKMDIEGAEPRAWLGMQQVLRAHRPVLITEYSPHLIQKTSACEPSDYLEQLWQAHTVAIIDHSSGDLRAVDTVEEIVQTQRKMAAAGIEHLDLIARPRP